MNARLANLLLGLWLFFSAFLWGHTTAQFVNSIVTGILCAGFAAAAIRLPPMRWFNVLVAAWLIISLYVLPTTHVATVYNYVAVALLVAMDAIFGATRARRVVQI